MAELRERTSVDRTAAETLIRTSVMALANGAPIRDLDQLVARNASRISHADTMAGRLGSDVLGDIIGTVEQAKGNTAFNWNAATPEQIKAYMTANGFVFGDHGRQGIGLPREGRESASPGRDGHSTDIRFGDIGQHNFASTPYHAAGMSYGTFVSLRQLGFDSSQIMAAVNTNKQLRLGANDNTAATARLQRDVPSAIPGLHATHDNWKGVHDLEQAEKDARTNGQAAQADQIKAQIEAARKQAQEHDQRERDRVRDIKPDRVPDLIDRQEAIKKAAAGRIASLEVDKGAKSEGPLGDGRKAKIEASTAIVENYRRNPDDAKARADYAALKSHATKDKGKARDFAALEKSLKDDATLRKSQTVGNHVAAATNEAMVADNNKVAAKNMEQVKTGDAALDLFNDDKRVARTPNAPKPEKAKAEPEKAGLQDGSKKQDTPAKTKVAANKQAGPSV